MGSGGRGEAGVEGGRRGGREGWQGGELRVELRREGERMRRDGVASILQPVH